MDIPNAPQCYDTHWQKCAWEAGYEAGACAVLTARDGLTDQMDQLLGDITCEDLLDMLVVVLDLETPTDSAVRTGMSYERCQSIHTLVDQYSEIMRRGGSDGSTD